MDKQKALDDLQCAKIPPLFWADLWCIPIEEIRKRYLVYVQSMPAIDAYKKAFLELAEERLNDEHNQIR